MIPSDENPGNRTQIWYSCGWCWTCIELSRAGVLLRNARLLDGRPLSYSSSRITGAFGPGHAAVDTSDDDEDVLLDMTGWYEEERKGLLGAP